MDERNLIVQLPDFTRIFSLKFISLVTSNFNLLNYGIEFWIRVDEYF